ncbi:helix-turn-helix domain-containing protein [Marinifilum flexuosum]|uniref:Excisionase family DNA binding protein n=1 Tax=Marinifilum flexuosum TaxID=1117708 RepID=A0A419X9I5_9BACT|nr:helix-turn-helix domain-containing protein [Marinifilum flexuosum]RKE04428.1 excisionase family DNA binding protein [Marinifilum flexuosum]
MEKGIQIIQVTPEQLQNAIILGVKEQLNQFSELFQPKEPTEYLTRDQVKDLLQVDLVTVYNWTKKGKLKAYGIGRRVYYKRKEVEQAIKPLNS